MTTTSGRAPCRGATAASKPASPAFGTDHQIGGPHMSGSAKRSPTGTDEPSILSDVRYCYCHVTLPVNSLTARTQGCWFDR